MRRITSIVLLLTFVTVSVTGLVMGPLGGDGHGPRHGNMGAGAGPSEFMAGAAMVRPGPSFFPKELHELAAYTMLAAGCVHLALNARMMGKHLGIGTRD